MRPFRIVGTALIVMISGCANWTSVYHRTEFDEKGVVMDAKQRAIVVKKWEGGSIRKSFACAEPSPDALASFAASIAAEVQKPEVIEGAIKAAFGDSASSLGGRTATIQLFRDALFRACEALMNNAIEETEYLLLAQKYQDAMVTLLAIEQLSTMHRNATGATVASKAEVGAPASSEAPSAAATATEAESEASTAQPQMQPVRMSATATPASSTATTLSDEAVKHIANAATHVVDRYYSRNPIELVCVQVVIRATTSASSKRATSLTERERNMASALETNCFEYLSAQIKELTRETQGASK
jgi:hypothetical protein